MTKEEKPIGIAAEDLKKGQAVFLNKGKIYLTETNLEEEEKTFEEKSTEISTLCISLGRSQAERIGLISSAKHVIEIIIQKQIDVGLELRKNKRLKEK